MGTSTSSRGPGGGVPLVPPWVPPPPDEPKQPPQKEPELAPMRRFQPARTHLGDFARTGSRQSLQRALGNYSRTGMGGAATAAARMAGTAHTAGGLYGVLQALSTGTAPPREVPLDVAELVGQSQSEIADRIVEALRPTDGTQDTDASRDAISRALSELLEADPQADLLALDQTQIELVVESYIANDLALRIDLDIGRTVLEKAQNPAEGVTRLEEIKAYVRQEIARAFRASAKSNQRISRTNAAAISSSVLRATLEVFESYL